FQMRAPQQPWAARARKTKHVRYAIQPGLMTNGFELPLEPRQRGHMRRRERRAMNAGLIGRQVPKCAEVPEHTLAVGLRHGGFSSMAGSMTMGHSWFRPA